jgi:hypothetical protein
LRLEPSAFEDDGGSSGWSLFPQKIKDFNPRPIRL